MKIATQSPRVTSTGRDTAGTAQAVTRYSTKLITVELVAGGASGNGDDVDIFTQHAFGGEAGTDLAPFSLVVLDAWARIDNAVGGSTLQLRTAPGGGGNALSEPMSSAAAGLARGASGTYFPQTAIPSSGKGLGPYIHRSDRSVTGMVYVLVLVR